MKNFNYKLTNTEHLTDEQIAAIEDGLSRKAFSCQNDFEAQLDNGHPINVLPEAIDEAYVTGIEIDGDDDYADIYVKLDCSKVQL